MTDVALDLSWFNDAACRGADPNQFHPDRGADSPRINAAAIAICHTCPVETQCLTYALDNNLRDGVWGGHSARNRRTLRGIPERRAEAFIRITHRQAG